MDPYLIQQGDDWACFYKPSGWVTHRSKWDRHSPAILQWGRDYLGGAHVFPVHRLDRATSGLILLAKSPEAARFYMGQFENRMCQKKYVALVRGFINSNIIIDKPLRFIRDDETKGDYEFAETQISVIARGTLSIPLGEFEKQRLSLIEAAPLTGRTHQIRRHLAKISHPIIGDTRYGDRHVNRVWRELGMTRLGLHSSSLQIAQAGYLESRLDSVFESAIKNIQWEQVDSRGIEFYLASEAKSF